MHLLTSLSVASILLAPLAQDAAAPADQGVRGLRVERPLGGGTWLPEGSAGGRPLDALAPAWPWYRLIVEADLGDEAQAGVVDDLLGRAGKLPARVAVLVVDLGERDAAALDWLLWTRGWHHAPVAFATTLDAPAAAGQPGWRLRTQMPLAAGQPILPGDPPAFDGALAKAAEMLAEVDRALARDVEFFADRLSEELAEVAAKLDVAELRDLQRKLDQSGASGDIEWDTGAVMLLVPAFDVARGHLLAEAELAVRMGQPLDAERTLEHVASLFEGDSAVAARAAELKALGLDKDALKAGKELRKILGDDLGARPDRTRGRLERFLGKRRPAAVAARALWYLALLERFAPAADD